MDYRCFKDGRTTIKYFINPESRYVTCVIHGCKDDPWTWYIDAKGAWKPRFVYDWCDECYQIKNDYVGIAKCAPDDIFDEKTGMKLAYRRAHAKRQGDMKQVMQRVLKELKQFESMIKSDWIGEDSTYSREKAKNKED